MLLLAQMCPKGAVFFATDFANLTKLQASEETYLFFCLQHIRNISGIYPLKSRDRAKMLLLSRDKEMCNLAELSRMEKGITLCVLAISIQILECFQNGTFNFSKSWVTPFILKCKNHIRGVSFDDFFCSCTVSFPGMWLLVRSQKRCWGKRREMGNRALTRTPSVATVLSCRRVQHIFKDQFLPLVPSLGAYPYSLAQKVLC